uniref:Uncharacterized protein n=1 Tax=Anguilla anguilla TaxID=7936 RepID=A0A0E9U788_ANGAN
MQNFPETSLPHP